MITLCLRGSQPQALVNNQQGPPLSNTNLGGRHSFAGWTCRLLHHYCFASNWPACFLFISNVTRSTYLKDFEKNDSHLSRILQKGNDCAIHVWKHPLEEALTGSGGGWWRGGCCELSPKCVCAITPSYPPTTLSKREFRTLVWLMM